MKYDAIIHNGWVITVNPAFEIIENGMVCVRNGEIAQVKKGGPDTNAYFADEWIDAAGGLVLPGLINTHVHLPMSIFRGLADDLPLAQWLNEHIFPAENHHMDAESVKAGARLSCLEMLLSGTTTCCDGYFLEDSVAEAVLEAGIRAVLAQGVIDFPAPGICEPARNLEVAAAYVSKWQNACDRIVPSIFCHSPYTCSSNTLVRAKEAAARAGVCFQIHVAETRGEADRIQNEHGISPVKYLDSLGILDERTLVSHAVWVDEGDIDILFSRGVGISHNPESNMKLASGVAPVPAFINAGIPVGLGTDGCASNNNLDLFTEMDTAAKLHKVVSQDPTVMDARRVLRMATIEGARAIGMERRIGSIEEGKSADLIIIDVRQPHLTPIYHPESHLVYAARGSDVRDVFVQGVPLVRDHEAAGLDAGAIMDAAAALGRKIWQTDRPESF
ncbi:MAG: amidohydrolase [Desulfobacterales bacterium]|nr:amidohydrolase [Desulfobacterales bacterium]